MASRLHVAQPAGLLKNKSAEFTDGSTPVEDCNDATTPENYIFLKTLFHFELLP